MNLQSRVAKILNDPRLADDIADEDKLIAEYGSDHAPEAIYLPADEFGWKSIFDLLVEILQDDNQSQHWETAQIVLFYAAGDHSHKTRECPSRSRCCTIGFPTVSTREIEYGLSFAILRAWAMDQTTIRCKMLA